MFTGEDECALIDKVSTNIKNTIARLKVKTLEPARQDVEELQQSNAILVAKINELETQLKERPRSHNREILEAAIAKHGIEPVDELLRMIANDEVSRDQKIKILLELNSYRVPKMKTSEVRHEHDYNIQVAIQSFGKGEAPVLKDITPRIPALEGGSRSGG